MAYARENCSAQTWDLLIVLTQCSVHNSDAGNLEWTSLVPVTPCGRPSSSLHQLCGILGLGKRPWLWSAFRSLTCTEKGPSTWFFSLSAGLVLWAFPCSQVTVSCNITQWDGTSGLSEPRFLNSVKWCGYWCPVYLVIKIFHLANTFWKKRHEMLSSEKCEN